MVFPTGEGLENETIEEIGAERSGDLFLMNLLGQLDQAMLEANSIPGWLTRANIVLFGFFVVVVLFRFVLFCFAESGLNWVSVIFKEFWVHQINSDLYFRWSNLVAVWKMEVRGIKLEARIPIRRQMPELRKIDYIAVSIYCNVATSHKISVAHKHRLSLLFFFFF